MFTQEQIFNAYVEYVRQNREHPERFLSHEEAASMSVQEEAALSVDWLVAVMEGRDPFE